MLFFLFQGNKCPIFLVYCEGHSHEWLWSLKKKKKKEKANSEKKEKEKNKHGKCFTEWIKIWIKVEIGDF